MYKSKFLSRRDQDNEATIENVKSYLGDYHYYKAISKRQTRLDLKSPVMTDMPSNHSTENHIEQRVVDKTDEKWFAEMIVAHCEGAIDAIEDDDKRKILKKRFIRHESMLGIAMEIGIAESTCNEWFKEACLTFADIYGLEELRVYKD